MRHKGLEGSSCPIGRSLEHVGDWWNILIIRDAMHGLTRFDEFQKSLEIPPNTLTRRLNALVGAGILERRPYNEHPPRYEYVITERGLDFRPVLLALLVWGNKHFAGEGVSVQVADTSSGRVVEPIIVDRSSGVPLDHTSSTFVPGPAANDSVRRRLAFAREKQVSVLRRARQRNVPRAGARQESAGSGARRRKGAKP